MTVAKVARYADDRFRQVLAGTDAQAFVREVATAGGQDPDIILAEVKRDTPAGRMILNLLGLDRRDVFPSHRPPDTIRANAICCVVDDLRHNGVVGQELYELAARCLAEPKLRKRHGVKLAGPAIMGKGRPPGPMTADAVREAYQIGRIGLLAKWLEAPKDPAVREPQPD